MEEKQEKISKGHGGLRDILTLNHQQASLDSSWSQQIAPLSPAAGVCHHEPLTFPLLMDMRFRLDTCDTSPEGTLSPLLATKAPNLFCRCSSAGADRAILLLLEATSLQALPWRHLCLIWSHLWLNQAVSICSSSKQMRCRYLSRASLWRCSLFPLPVCHGVCSHCPAASRTGSLATGYCYHSSPWKTNLASHPQSSAESESRLGWHSYPSQGGVLCSVVLAPALSRQQLNFWP